jgi:hypothetical protein
VIVGGSGESTCRALLLYVFLRENTHKLDAGGKGESGNLLQWDYQTVGYIGMGYLDVLGDCIPMVDTHVRRCYCMFSSGKTHTNWTLEGRGIVVWDCCFLLSGQVWEDIGMGYLGRVY